ncbi:MAG TPA: beta-galactosidase [Humibacter sp.]|nr:beta-galactosidase [Humibacter sp.]
MIAIPGGHEPGLLFGGDYNPEQWPEEVWHDDIRLMKQAGVNTATVGVFAWSSIEPAEGRYEFGWLDRVFDLLSSNGIGIILATPTASPPPWFSRAHPEALPIRKDGVRLMHGSRDTYNPAAPAYREAAVRVARALAERYGTHPSLRAWHLHNEYGTVGYGPLVDVEFRVWLRQRYRDLDTLNAAWHTAFWSQGYAEWDDILAPQETQYLPNPTQVLDFKRFTGDLLRDCYSDQIAVVRELSPQVPVTTNFMLPEWLHYDHWDFADESDFVSIDHYIDAAGADGGAHAAFGADQARSFGHGKPWLLMEQAANTRNTGGRILANEPGQVMRTSLQHVARGAFGILFFQWRAPYAGAEFFHSTMVPHVGEDSRVFREVVQLGQLLGGLSQLALAPAGGVANRHRVAIAWDADAWWAAETASLPSDAFSLYRAARRTHRALWYLGVNSDFVRLDHDLSGYAVVLVPSQLLVTDQQTEALRAFVHHGGRVVVWYFSGTFDGDLHIIPGGYSGAFAELLGVRVTELLPLEQAATIELEGGRTASEWSERLELRGAEVVRRYATGPAAGLPAVTAHEAGAGRAWYVSTELDDAALTELLAEVLDAAGVGPEVPGAGGGLEAITRFAGENSYLILINHDSRDRAATVDGTDVLTGAHRNGEITLPSGDMLVLRRPNRG